MLSAYVAELAENEFEDDRDNFCDLGFPASQI